ncbi:MAG TPA: hypothetical protein VL978_07640 [Puia sp.]|nr:hypothetical protein [Puia sp.]
MLIIRIKALFLAAIFTGNFLVVCHCSAAERRVSAAMQGCTCCPQKAVPCTHKVVPCPQKAVPCMPGKPCPGMQAVKFNLLEKKTAAKICLGPVEAMVFIPRYMVPAVEGRLARRNVSSWYLPPHAPPDRLALYQCFLI